MIGKTILHYHGGRPSGAGSLTVRIKSLPGKIIAKLDEGGMGVVCKKPAGKSGQIKTPEG